MHFGDCVYRMLIPKKNRKIIYEHLFKEGVLWAKKDFNAPIHPEVEGVTNLQLIKSMQVCFYMCLCVCVCVYERSRELQRPFPPHTFSH